MTVLLYDQFYTTVLFEKKIPLSGIYSYTVSVIILYFFKICFLIQYTAGETHVGLFYVFHCGERGCSQSFTKTGSRIYDSVIRNYTFNYLFKSKMTKSIQ